MLAPLKVHVIDAQSLDADLMRMLQGMWSEVCAQAGTRFCSSLQPELDGLLRGALWYLSMWRCSATLGQQMQNLHCVAANSVHLPEALKRSGAALELPTPSLKASGLPAAVVPRTRRLLFGLLTVFAHPGQSRLASGLTLAAIAGAMLAILVIGLGVLRRCFGTAINIGPHHQRQGATYRYCCPW